MEKLVIIAVGAAVFWFCFGLVQGALSSVFKEGLSLKGCLGCLSLLVVAVVIVGGFALLLSDQGPSKEELASMSDMDVRMHLMAETMRVSEGKMTSDEYAHSPYVAEFERRGLSDK